MAWEQLRAILDLNKADRQAEEAQPPSACPIDGYPLEVGPEGVRNCPLGNYTWRG